MSNKLSQSKPNHSNSNVIKFSALALSITALSGCGGGGDSSGSPTNSAPTTPTQCTAAQYLDTASNVCISKISQVITGFSLPALSVGDFAMLNARASSGLPINYNSVTPNICTVQAALNRVTAIAVGQCLIAADQVGDTKTLPAQQVVATIQVTASAAPTKLLNEK